MAAPIVDIALAFEERDAQLLRFRVSVRWHGDDPQPEPILIERLGGGGKPKRLAVVERKSGKFVELAAAPPDTRKLNFQLSGNPDQHVAYWRWTVFVETSAGGPPVLRVAHPKAKKFAQLPISARRQQLNKGDPTAVKISPGPFPRLIVALNNAPVAPGNPPPDDPGLGHASDLQVVLEYIHRRLVTPTTPKNPGERPSALEEAWVSENAEPLPEVLPDNKKIAYAEEAWARQVAEMLSLTPYAGPGQTYFYRGNRDHEFIGTGIDGRRAGDPVYGLVHACQHLAQFAISSRGLFQAKPFPKSSGLKGLRMVTAGSVSATIVKEMGGAWFIGGKPPKRLPPPAPGKRTKPADLDCEPVLQQSDALFEIDGRDGFTFGAASVMVFCNRKFRDQVDQFNKTGTGSVRAGNIEYQYKNSRLVGKWRILPDGLLADNTDGAHIGFVLRSNPKIRRFQLLDTGGFGVLNRGKNVTVLGASSGFHTGNFDGPATDRVTGKVPYRGVGVWPTMTTADATKLETHVRDILEKARPLGFARLVMVEAGTKVTVKKMFEIGTPAGSWLLYASPLLRMWDTDPRQNYSIARYVWSLRGVPRGGTDVMWFIYLPRGPLAEAALAGRARSLTEMAEEAFTKIKNPVKRQRLAKKPDLKVARVLAEYTLPIIDMASRPGGTVFVTYKFPKQNRMSKLHYAERTQWDGKVRLPMDRAVLLDSSTGAGDTFPAYFKGG